MPTLPNIGIVTPTLGGDSGTWDDKINAALALLDAHDHTSGKGVQVPVSGLNINANLSMADYALTNTGQVAFTAVTALSSGSKVLFVSSSDNELYWRTNGGTNVKLTNGTSINTTLVGGIVGDYSAVGAEVAFDDANKRYTFKDQSAPSKKWARLASGPVRIYEYNTTETVYVEHAIAAATAVSYTVTWPAALPAAKSRVYITAAGDIGFTPDDEVLTLTGAAWQSNAGSYNLTYGSAVGLTGGTSTNWILPIPLKVGDTIKSVTVQIVGNVAADGDLDALEFWHVNSAGTRTSLGSTSANNVANTLTDFTINVTDTTIAAGDYVFGRLQISGATGTAMEIRNTQITYTPRI